MAEGNGVETRVDPRLAEVRKLKDRKVALNDRLARSSPGKTAESKAAYAKLQTEAEQAAAELSTKRDQYKRGL